MRAPTCSRPPPEPETRKALLAEWVEAMSDGPGVVAFRGAFADTAVIDRTTEIFHAMIAEQHAAGTGGGDHFAKPGANDRIWNALEKLCLRDPETFAAYYANEIVALVSEAWLGPAYQITSQINCRQPRRRGAIGPSRLSSRLPDGGDDRALSRPTSTACRRC